MEVHTLPVPSAQSLHSEGMAQVIWSRSAPARFRLQTGQLEKMPESAACGLNWQSGLVGTDEESHVRT
jgi:hypothetical protein